MIEGKVWGVTELVTANGACELHRIQIKPGGYCSEHCHQTKCNGFYVLAGKLLVRTWRPGGLVDETVLHAGQYVSVSPGIKHQFEALTDVDALELYWAEPYSRNDIVRETNGGMRSG